MNNHITIQRQLLCCLFRENSAGCAIGIGNVWRFPYVAGQNGGGVFVLFYLIFLLCMGVPVLTMELAVDVQVRRVQSRPIKHWRKMARNGIFTVGFV